MANGKRVMSKVPKPEIEADEKHWASNDEARSDLLRVRDRFMLTNTELMLALGGIKGIGSYQGTLDEAIQDVRDYMARRALALIDTLETSTHDHAEALVTMFSSRPIVGPSGRLYNVTARNGAKADDIVGTVLEFERAMDMLADNGFKEG